MSLPAQTDDYYCKQLRNLKLEITPKKTQINVEISAIVFTRKSLNLNQDPKIIF